MAHQKSHETNLIKRKCNSINVLIIMLMHAMQLKVRDYIGNNFVNIPWYSKGISRSCKQAYINKIIYYIYVCCPFVEVKTTRFFINHLIILWTNNSSRSKKSRKSWNINKYKMLHLRWKFPINNTSSYIYVMSCAIEWGKRFQFMICCWCPIVITIGVINFWQSIINFPLFTREFHNLCTMIFLVLGFAER